MRMVTADSKLVHKNFERQVALTPGSIAIKYRNEHTSYTELNRAADRLAAMLRAEDVREGSIVALAMSRNAEMVAAMLAVLKCGAAYLPLDSQSPTSRLVECMEEAGVKIIVANKPCDKVMGNGRRCVWAAEIYAAESAVNCEESADIFGDEAAYVMYTSGSTGGPKGVVVPHRAIHRLVRNQSYVDIGPGDHILHVSPPEFDASTFEVWGPLLNGATTVLYPEETIDPNLLDKVIKENNISIIFLTSALFHLVAAKFTTAFETIKFVLTGGDVVSPKVINQLFDVYPEINIIACYGPTENTTFTTTHLMTVDNRPASTVPIGRPISGTSVHVLDEDLKPVPVGEPGELFTSGSGVALGYMNRKPDSNSFFHDAEITDGLIYRTGDLVRENSAGVLEFIGRKDNQVKLRGFRMSLEEVQAALLDLEYVIDAAVMLQKHETGEKHMIALVNLQAGFSLAVPEIKRDLGNKIPAYMIPDVIYTDVELYINKNGKLDKKKINETLVC